MLQVETDQCLVHLHPSHSELLGTGQEIAKVTLQKATLEAREPLKQKT